MNGPKVLGKPIVCTYWNIGGYWSKNLGNKLEDPEFLQVIEGSDIIGLGELHSDKKLSIPGFISIDQKISEKKFKGPKIA